MALISCPECNNDISDTVKKCPKCGYNIKSYYRKKVTLKKKNEVHFDSNISFISKFIDKLQIIKSFKYLKIILFSCLVVSICLFVFLSYQKNVIPNIVMLNSEKAIEILEKKEFEYKIEYDYTDNYDEGIVFSQSIDAGEKYNKQPIILMVSKGKNIYFENIVGKNINQYKELLEPLEIDYIYQYDYTLDKNYVIKTSKKEGDLLHEGDKVTITVSEGKYQNIPNTVGISVEEAVEELRSKGLLVEIIKELSNQVEEGSVISYSPTIYGEAASTLVSLVVSDGGYLTIPNARLYEIDEAIMKIEEIGIQANVEYTYNNMSMDCNDSKATSIVSQSIKGKVPESTKSVSIEISKPSIILTNVDWSINYVGGVDTYLTFKNISNKDIAYITFEIAYYDRMGGKANCTITGGNRANLSYTGPLKADKTASRIYWDAVIYNNTTSAIEPISAFVEFADGSTQRLDYLGMYWFDSEFYGNGVKN